MQLRYRQSYDEQKKTELQKFELADRFPATIRMAKMHLLANKFGYLLEEGSKIQKCPCCEQYVENNNFNYFLTEEQSQKLPSGVFMFFQMIKIMMLYLVLRLAIGDGFNLVTNYLYGECTNCSFYLQSSLGIEITTDSGINSLITQQILNFVIMMVSVLYFFLCRMYITAKFFELDSADLAEDDYTILVENLPSIIEDRAEDENTYANLKNRFERLVREWLQDNLEKRNNKYEKTYQHFSQCLIKKNSSVRQFLDSRQPIIANIDLCWDIAEFQELEKHKDILKNQILKMYDELVQKDSDIKKTQARIQQAKSNNNEAQIKQLQLKLQIDNQYFECLKQRFSRNEKNILSVNQQILQLSYQYGKAIDPTSKEQNPKVGFSPKDFQMTHFINQAFVKFEYQHFARFFQKELKSGAIIICDNVLEGQRAPPPSDMYFPNLYLTTEARFRKQIIAFLITIAALVFSFAIMMIVNYFKVNLTGNINKLYNSTTKNGALEGKLLTQVLSITSSVVVVATNYILKLMMVELSKYEQHESKTQNKLSFIYKLLLAQFVNSALTYLIACKYILNLPMDDTNGLIQNVSSLFTTSAVINVMLNIANPTLWLKEFMIWYKFSDKNVMSVFHQEYNLQMLKQIENEPHVINNFQDRVNKQFELPDFDIADRYAEYLLQIYIVAFFGYLVPLGTVVTIIFLLVQLLIDRYNIFKLYTLNFEFNFSMTKVVMRMVEASMVVMGIGNWIVGSFYLKTANRPWSIAALLFSVVYVLIVNLIKYDYEDIFVKDLPLSDVKFSDVSRTFKDSYKTQNPATTIYESSRIENPPTYITVQDDIAK